MPFCKQCGKEIPQDARFCPYCGMDQTSIQPSAPQIQAGLETKNTGLAAVLALILGILGLWGVGHIYVGKIGRGLALLILGIVLEWGFGLFIFSGIISGIALDGMHPGLPRMLGGLIIGVVIWGIVTLVIFIWQIYDAYKLAKYYNEYVQRYRKAPW